MRKIAILAAIVTIFSLSATFAATTDHGKFDMNRRFEIGVDFGAYSPDSMSGNGNYLDSEFDWGGNMKYYFNTNFAFGLKYHVWNHDDNYPNTGFYGSLTSALGSSAFDEYGRGSFDMDIDSFDITAYYYFNNPTNHKVRPFIGLGATHFSVDYRYTGDRTAGITLLTSGNTNAGTVYESLSAAPGGIAANDWADFSVSENTWGFHAVGGVEYWPNPDFSIRGEIKYMNADLNMNMAPDRVGTTAGTRVADEENLDLSGFYYGIGFTYHFDGPTTSRYEERMAEEDMIY
ncbi:MAG: hypothetical protein CVV64_03145 [Candidatus Wallbacteria bacterium HGW-Wallbacteria-1]|jgi:hypothetical protein|uniref:Outer membrane protein beta-barrel domain-containing protein n=1 Tax=Candidatus Wallbacteria bacterium HGW-Wallbacteria-1 TaxID=2013854 RepID=A0A2N1PTN6_9BACT|nr:MAG: hypothetical protein CVV64_03145 [Candidatus Wallbacteria bacterium HGW-Wallbacteria-1]